MTTAEQLKRSQKASSWLCSKTIALSLIRKIKAHSWNKLNYWDWEVDEAIARASQICAGVSWHGNSSPLKLIRNYYGRNSTIA